VLDRSVQEEVMTLSAERLRELRYVVDSRYMLTNQECIDLTALIDAQLAAERDKQFHPRLLEYALAFTTGETTGRSHAGDDAALDETCDALEGMAMLYEQGDQDAIEDVAIDYLRDAVKRLRASQPSPQPAGECSCGMDDASAGLHADWCARAIKPAPAAAAQGGEIEDLIRTYGNASWCEGRGLKNDAGSADELEAKLIAAVRAPAVPAKEIVEVTRALEAYCGNRQVGEVVVRVETIRRAIHYITARESQRGALSETQRQGLTGRIILNVCELSDYTSPDDQPDLLQCTVKELEACIERALEGVETSEPALTPQLREAMMFGAKAIDRLPADDRETWERHKAHASALEAAAGGEKP
jgi:hypothetical protein